MSPAPPQWILLVRLRSWPRSCVSLVVRTRLTERLGAGLDRSLILISGPVEFGKTMLLGEWLGVLAKTVPTAWLSLDEDDDDPVRFLTYVVAALHGCTRA
jgi:LuxR family maltose regulon positive regulatory protein